jgi:hypothetical protein
MLLVNPHVTGFINNNIHPYLSSTIINTTLIITYIIFHIAVSTSSAIGIRNTGSAWKSGPVQLMALWDHNRLGFDAKPKITGPDRY